MGDLGLVVSDVLERIEEEDQSQRRFISQGREGGEYLEKSAHTWKPKVSVFPAVVDILIYIYMISFHS